MKKNLPSAAALPVRRLKISRQAGHAAPASIGPRPRLVRLDALRGLAVALMVAHHFLYDLVWLWDAPPWLFWNPVFDVLHDLFVGVFVGLSGICCRFSRSNLRRGVQLLACAMVITAVSAVVDRPVLFGILHLLAFCMLFYGLVGRWTDRLPLPVHAAAFLLSLLWLRTTALRSPLLWFLGVPWPALQSADYFPIFPWLFLFTAGARLGGTLLRWQFAARRAGPLARVGRHALPLYLLHQPVLLGLLTLLLQVKEWFLKL